MKRVQPVE